mgnify:CR=1 FL=1
MAPAADAVADAMLRAALGVRPLPVLEFSVERSEDAERLMLVKSAAEILVRTRLARFTGDSRIEIEPTNTGRYWTLSGSYFGYLKGEPTGTGAAGVGRGRNPEMDAFRADAECIKLRLDAFWWSFGLSIAGFVMSLLSLSISLLYGHRFLC